MTFSGCGASPFLVEQRTLCGTDCPEPTCDRANHFRGPAKECAVSLEPLGAELEFQCSKNVDGDGWRAI